MKPPLRQRLAALAVSLTKFALVGGLGFVVDVTVFNILRATVLAPEAIHHGPLIAKIVSTLAAIVANWLGNRYWTFRHARRSGRAGEFVEFLVTSVATMPISLLCLWISREVLGYTSQLADNVSGMIVGTILGSAVRYVLYRTWVFRVQRPEQVPVGTTGTPS